MGEGKEKIFSKISKKPNTLKFCMNFGLSDIVLSYHKSIRFLPVKLKLISQVS